MAPRVLRIKFVLRIMFGAAALTLAGCQMHSPYGYGGGTYGYPSSGPGAMMGPSGTTSYVTPSSPYVGGPAPTGQYYPTTNNPFPSSSPNPIPNTGGTIPQPTTNPFTSNTPRPPSAPLSNSSSSTRPIDKLPPDADEYPEPPATRSSDASRPNPPSLSDSEDQDPVSRSDEQDPADIRSDQKGTGAAPKSAGDAWIDELENEGGDKIPGGAANQDPQIKKSAFFEDGEDEFAPPSEFNPGEEMPTGDEAEDPAIFMRTKEFFRGIAKFDDAEQRWYLEYKPDADIDTGEGILYFAEKSILSSLKNGTRVVVTGKFDSLEMDQFNRPLYIIQGLKKIEPLPKAR